MVDEKLKFMMLNWYFKKRVTNMGKLNKYFPPTLEYSRPGMSWGVSMGFIVLPGPSCFQNGVIHGAKITILKPLS